MKRKILLTVLLPFLLGGLLIGQTDKPVYAPAKQFIPVPENTTLLAPTSVEEEILLDESFEGDLVGWSYADNDGDGYNWSIFQEDATYDVAYTGSYGAGVYYNATGNDDWLITPQIVIPSTATNVTFSFWAHSHSSTYLEDFNVKLSTAGTSLDDFSNTLGTVSDVPDSWTEYSYDLSDYAGESIYLAVQCVSVDDWYLFADDFLLTVETSGSGDAITSTTSGGNWSETSTWIGGAVPTAADNVVIDGNVTVDYNSDCNDLTVNAGNVLISDAGLYQVLTINGDLINNGSIQDNGDTELKMELLGNLENNANMDNDLVELQGTIAQEITLQGQSFLPILRLHAMVGSNSFQWYKDGNALTGETDDRYEIEAISSSDFGTYYCSTDEGDSREIVISGDTEPSDLTAAFTADVTSGIAPLTVNFTDQSTGATSWDWDFGDGNSSSDQHPSHTYQSNGSYTVSLTVSDGTNDVTETKPGYISVSDEPGDEPGGWFMQNPYPTANDLNDIYPIDDNTAIAVGVGGLILKTTDGGETWTPRESGTTEDLNDIIFPGNATGYIVGNQPTGGMGVALKTSDGGETWTSFDVGIEDDLNGVFFTDANTGWIVGGYHLTSSYKAGYIKKTTDGGETWTTQTSPVDDQIWSVQFIDANTGWIGGYEFFATTTDGGATWTQIDVPVEDFYVYDFHFVSETEGWLPLGYLGLYHTTNGGDTWNETTAFSGDSPGRAYFTDSDNGWVSSDDLLYQTTDGGATWTEQIDLPGYSDLYVQGINAGWFVTTSGKIYKTESGNWEEASQTIISENISEVSFADEYNGWIVGSMDNIWATTDGGMTWTEQSTPAHYTLEGIDFVDTNTGWAVGHAPYGGEAKIYHTSDAGATWTEQTSGTENLLWDVDFVDATTGWAVGYEGTILHTSDGTTWSVQSSGTSETLEQVFFIDTQTGWSCGQNGTILHTSNGGSTWNTQSNPDDNNLYGIYFLDANHGFAVGVRATLLETSDGGETWTVISSGSYSDPDYYAITFGNASDGWIVGSEGLVMVTNDGGSNWEAQVSNAGVDLAAVCFVDATTGWAVGDNGAILKTSNGGQTPVGIADPGKTSGVVASYRLYQNYPNPFNPSTTLMYDLPEASYVRILIYDLRGQLVEELASGHQRAGHHLIHWNATQHPSGVYFVQMTADNFTSVKKVMLVK